MIFRPVNSGDRVFLIDGSGFIFRAYHALPPLTRASDDLPIGAVSGFCNMLFKLTEELKAGDSPTHIAVIFDASSKTFRNDIYPAYKANRPPPPDDLVPQFALCREACRAFGIIPIELLGYEADDLIATYAYQAQQKNIETRIYSSDKDLMQLINDTTHVICPLKNKLMGYDAAIEKFGVSPDKIPFVQALSGDSIDNIPGVPGIGVKTAAQLINEFNTLENLLNNAHTIPQQKRRENLVEYANNARLSFELVTLKRDVPTQSALEDFGFQEPQLDIVLSFLSKMELKTLAKRVEARLTKSGSSPILQTTSSPSPVLGTFQQGDFFQSFSHKDPVQEKNYHLIDTIDQFENLLDTINQLGHFVFDTETTGLDILSSKLVGLAISCGVGHGAYIPLGHNDGKQLDKDFVLDKLKPFFISNQFLKIAHNIKYDMAILKNEGVDVVCYDDTMLMSYVLYAGKHRHNMDDLAEIYLNHKTITFEDVVGKGKNQKTFNQIPINQALNYAAEDAEVTYRLWNLFSRCLIVQKQHCFYQSLERKMPEIVCTIERNGFKIDRDWLKQLSDRFEKESGEIAEKIFEIAGESFNIASPKQIAQILFDKLKISYAGKQKTTATGQSATGADILEDLAAEGHEIADLILKWRGLQKLKSTYCDSLQIHANIATDRVHSSFHLTGAATGRFSSSDPNLQNIPIKTPEGQKVRQAFIASDKCSIVSADYSQIELRLLAHCADIDLLKESFKNNEDIHARTASEVFGVPLSEVSGELRRKAKAVNFGIIYGISAFGLSAQLKITQAEAKYYIETYFKRLPQVKTYMQQTIAFARDKHFVLTPFGRKIWIKDINSKNYSARAFSERAAINAPLQGAAADCIKYAMIDVDKVIRTHYPDVKFLSQVHDELLFEVPNQMLDIFKRNIQEIMQQAPLKAVRLTIPLVVEVGHGINWREAH